MLVEDVDFRHAWTSPELLGQKALAVSLSDIAAMGGTPQWAMVSIGVTQGRWDSDFLPRFYEGWHKMAAFFGVELVGGDVSRSPDRTVIDSIVGGVVSKGKAIMRSGAEPGDQIFVTGQLGGAAGGLMLLETGISYASADVMKRRLITRLIRPEPRVEIGHKLVSGGLATAMIDISDGLGSDLLHVCEASGVGAELYAEAIPVDPDLAALSLSKATPMGMALGGGEDFELLFTVAKEKVSHLQGIGAARIGEITEKIGTIEVIDENGSRFSPPKGYRHF
jgi:thiamine-monophosphate kinase